MEEATCPRCSAVFVTSNTAGLCPNCSYNYRTLFARIRSFDSNLVALIFLLVFSLFVIHSVILFGIAAAQVWSIFAQKAKIGLYKPPIALDLETRKPNPTFIPVSKPPILGEWKPLTMLARPRDVSLSPKTFSELAFTTAVHLAVLAAFIRSFWGQITTFAQHPLDSLFDLIWLGLWLFIGAAGLRDWIVAREILRDGELTTGLLTDWREGEHGPSISQFWTDSGLRFERRGKVVTKEELANEKDPLNVFYLPHDPKKSVALCCTSLRLKIR